MTEPSDQGGSQEGQSDQPVSEGVPADLPSPTGFKVSYQAKPGGEYIVVPKQSVREVWKMIDPLMGNVHRIQIVFHGYAEPEETPDEPEDETPDEP